MSSVVFPTWHMCVQVGICGSKLIEWACVGSKKHLCVCVLVGICIGINGMLKWGLLHVGQVKDNFDWYM